MTPVTKQPHNPIADTSAHNTRNARTRSLWQRCLMLVALLMTCALGVKAEEYVLYYDNGTTKFYMANVNNTLTVLTDENYDANTCVWERTSGGKFSNNGKEIYVTYSSPSLKDAGNGSDLIIEDGTNNIYRNIYGTKAYIIYDNTSANRLHYSTSNTSTNIKAANPPTSGGTQFVDEAGVTAAKANIIVGVGYPKTTSAEYIALNELTANTKTQAEVDALVEAYMTSTDILLPENGKAYTFTNVMGDNARTKRYIKHENGKKVSVSAKANDATVFVCRELSEGVYAFVAPDGNILTWVGNNETGAYKENGNIYGYSSEYATEYNGRSDWNKITIKKNKVPANTEEFGHVRMVARRNSDGVSAFIISNAENRFDQAGDNYYFNENYSSAWLITEAPYPTNDEAVKEALAKIDKKEGFVKITPAPQFVANSDYTEFTLTCTQNEGFIYYTTDGSDPTFSANNPEVLGVGESAIFDATEGITVKAYAHKDGCEPSAVVTQVMNLIAIDTAEKLAAITGSGIYVITADITVTSHVSITNFTGLLDGGYHTISGLTTPLFASATGATIRNVVLDEVKIPGGTGNVGAIVGTASGATRIYNCGVLSGSISGTSNVGSIAGSIDGTARVINCYSFADITGGTTVGGIVGNNTGTYTAGAPKTLVMNCAYYGQLTGGTNKYPIFGGNNITNDQGENTYNFFRYDESTTYAGYNAAQAIFKDEYLNRFGFYQRILDSHRELAAYYAFNDVSKVDEIGKWTLDRTRAPYPIVTKHLSNTRKTLDRTIPNTQEDYAGKKIKDINVIININGAQVYNGTLPLTDMNTAEWDYTYGKIVLPFANEFTGWSIGDAQAITGWKISTNDYYYDQNNVFDNKNYVYAQGGNYIVPEGVESITLTAYIAPAVYLSDANYDVVYNSSYTNSQARGGATPTTYKGQMVHNSLSSAINALKLTSNETRPHEQAIVLVGNYHYNQKIESDVLPQSTISYFYTNKPFTLMSADKDNDQEPDYCFYQYHAHGSGRTLVHPARFDFLAAPGIGMAAHIEGASAVPSIGIWHCKGWFELTETYLGIMQECEIRPANFLTGSPWILNGGIFEEINMSSTHEYYYENSVNSKLTYMRIGGNVYINNFYPGTQSKDATFTTPLKPICMSGGEVVSCYMTGKQAQKSNTSGSVNFYCNGGYIHEFLGAYLEPLATNQDINIRVDHAIVDNFYGGGANENQVTPGNINITINNSHIDFFCGGPKFGNMVDGKNVTINAVGTTFGEFYGGGYGGTALTRSEVKGETVDFTSNRPYNLNFQSYYTGQRLKYDANLGIPVNYALQYFMYAGGGGRGVQKFNVDYARLSLAAVLGNINANLTDCTILNNYYGGGCQGSVTGNITSTLNNCKVHGSAFAGGYTASATPCLVATTEQPTYSEFIISLGFFTPFGEAQTEEFYWKPSDDGHAVGTADDTHKYLYTSEEKFTRMGEVDGNTTIEIKGANSHIYGSVFGGGNASKVIGNTKVHVKDGKIGGSVFGAGNEAEVTGKTEVIIGGDNNP